MSLQSFVTNWQCGTMLHPCIELCHTIIALEPGSDTIVQTLTVKITYCLCKGTRPVFPRSIVICTVPSKDTHKAGCKPEDTIGSIKLCCRHNQLRTSKYEIQG